MSKQAHTPGPWEVGTREGFNANTVYDRSGKDSHGDKSICDVFGIPMHKFAKDVQEAEGMPNARLIAAAPELLAALEFMVCNYAVTDWPSDQIAREMCLAAISKATGK